MSETPEEWAVTSSSSPTLSQRNPGNITQTISLIDEFLAKANSPQEALDWAKVREVILRQEEEVKQENYRRFKEKSRFIYKLAFSGVAFLSGIVLFICGYQDAVYLIGLGLIPLVSIRKAT